MFQSQKWEGSSICPGILGVAVARIAHARGMSACWLHDLGDGGCCVQKYQNEVKLLAWLPCASIDTGVLSNHSYLTGPYTP
jgi:hypothetical protein